MALTASTKSSSSNWIGSIRELDALDLGDQLLRLVPEVLVAEQRHHAVGLPRDAQALVDREQAELRCEHVGEHRQGQRGAEPVARRVPRHLQLRQVDVDGLLGGGPENGTGDGGGERHELGLGRRADRGSRARALIGGRSPNTVSRRKSG